MSMETQTEPTAITAAVEEVLTQQKSAPAPAMTRAEAQAEVEMIVLAWRNRHLQVLKPDAFQHVQNALDALIAAIAVKFVNHT